MKIKVTLLVSLALILSQSLFSQTPDKQESGDRKSKFIKNQDYLEKHSPQNYSSFYGDSLNGFDEEVYRAEFLNRGLYGQEFTYAMNVQKRYFVDSKYKIGTQAKGYIPNQNSNTLKPISPGNVVNVLPCVNEDFEATSPGQYNTANGVSGWTVESGFNTSVVYPPNVQYGAGCVGNPIPSWTQGSPEFWIVNTPFLNAPYIGNIPNSPLGGTNVAKLQDNSPNGLMTRISTQFPVTNANTLFQFAYAGAWNGAHECCGQPAFRVDLYNCTGSLIPLPCANVSLTPSSAQCIGVSGYSTTGFVSWTNWLVKYIDLTPYIGQCVRLVVTCSDCSYGGHDGSAFFDARCGGQLVGQGLGGVGGYIPGAVSFCAGSNQAVIAAPFGYASYQWIAPGGFAIPSPLGTAPTLTVNSPVPGSVYTVQASSAAGCQYIITNTINFSQVNIAGIGFGPSCPGGASGTATVQGNGSGTGYNYTWLNTSSVTVGTSSIISGLAPGIYSIVLTGFGAAGCGSAVTTVTIGTAPQSTIGVYKPYCNNEAYLSAGAGSNFHWYNNLTPISPPQGIAPSLTVTSPVNGGVYWLSYLSAQGCQDSIKFTLGLSAPGVMAASQIPLICPGGNNGTAVISITPAPGAPPGQNSYSVFSIGTTTPAYSASLATGPSTAFPVSGMTAGTYSVNGFDGSCKYGITFNVTALVYNYTLSPVTTSLCPGNAVAAGITFSAPPSPTQYSYSWTPSTWLAGNVQQSTIISPTVAPGTVINQIYTVVVTPTAANCPLTKTLSITAINPIVPSIAQIPPLCNTSAPYTITAVPGGGTFSAANATLLNASTGVLSPSFVPSFGTHTLTYSHSIYTCVATNSATFQVSQFNTSALTASVPNLCVTNPAFNLMNIVQSSVNGVWSGTGVVPQGPGFVFNPSNLNTGIYPIQYITTSSPNPTICPSITNLNVSVTKTTTPYIVPKGEFCNNAVPFTLTVTPGGGGWTGNGVSNQGVVTPTAYTNPGSFNVTYTVTDGPCLNSNSILLTVSKFVSATLTAQIPYLCSSNNPFNLMSIVQNTTGTWQPAPGLVNNMLNPTFIQTGYHTYVYYTPSIPNGSVCPDSSSATTHVMNPPTPNISLAGPFCNNGGPVQMTVSPATGSWTPSPYLNTNGLFTPSLCPVGNNQVQYVIGTNTCNVAQSVSVSVEAFVTAALSSNVPDQCNTNSPYNLQYVTQNNLGTWSGPGISGGSFNPSTVGSGVFILSYNTQSSPSGLCPDQSTVAVAVYSLSTPSITKIGPFCNSGSPKQIQVSPAGGLFGGANNNAVSPGGLFHPASAIIGNNVINYSVTSGPCVAYAQTTVSIEEYISPDFAKQVGPFCRNAEPVNMNSYVLNPGGSWSGPGISGSQFNPGTANIGSNNFIIYQTHSMPTASLCPDSSAVRIKVNDLPNVVVSSNTSGGCAPVEVLLSLNSSNTGTGYWNFGDGSEPKQGLTTTYIYNLPGTYTVVFSYEDEIGCRGQGQVPPIVVHEVPNADFSAPAEVLISNPEVRLTNLTENLVNNKYSWKVDQFYQSTEVHPVVRFEKIGRYQVNLEAVNNEGCTDKVTKTIEVKNDFNVYIPSSFTPNYDGLNDVFIPVFSPYGLDTKTYELEVFDRWGHSLFYTKDYSKGWDGTVQNKGSEELKEEVYIYRIKYKDLDGNVYNKMGHVSLLK